MGGLVEPDGPGEGEPPPGSSWVRPPLVAVPSDLMVAKEKFYQGFQVFRYAIAILQ